MNLTMFSQSRLVHRNISVHLETSSTAIEQLAETLRGNCYKSQVTEHGLYQSFLFEKKANAKQFFIDVFRFPEVVSVGFEKFL